MHIPPVDRARDETEWRSFVEAQQFGQLIAPGSGLDWPAIAATQFVLDGNEVLVHFACPNPVLDAVERDSRAVLAVAGDWAFIPSSWKAIGDEDPLLGIPTTYYAAVQLRGQAEVRSEPADVAAVLRRQLAKLQPTVAIADPEEAHPGRLRAIRAVVLQVEDVVAKFKFGGNVDAAHREAVLERLATRSGPGDAAAATHTRRRLGQEQ